MANVRRQHDWHRGGTNLRDEGDNHLVALAVAGGARFIVTRNTRDLARTGLHFPGLEAVTPEQWVAEMNRWLP